MSNPTSRAYCFPIIMLRGGWFVQTRCEIIGWVSVLVDNYGNQKGDICCDGDAIGVAKSRELLVARHEQMYSDLDLTIAASVV